VACGTMQVNLTFIFTLRLVWASRCDQNVGSIAQTTSKQTDKRTTENKQTEHW